MNTFFIIIVGIGICSVTQLESPVLALEGINGSFVIIGWEGETYLVKRTLHPEVENCIIRFNFEESVAGKLSYNITFSHLHMSHLSIY